MLLPEPLPAHVKVRVSSPGADDDGKIGVIVGAAEIAGWDWIVRFADGHQTLFKDSELEVVP